jgi:LysM repeat protein
MLRLLLLAAAAFGGDFNDFVPGPRPFTAAVDDPWAIYVNPAGSANTPYTQLTGGLGRLQSPIGTNTYMALGYLRPYEPIPTAVVGGGYYMGRQTDGGSKDVFALHYSQEMRVRQLPLAKPLRVGGNFKFINVDQRDNGNFGLGFDGGVLARSNFGLSGAFSVRDLVSNVGIRRPTWTLGTAYTWRRWATLMSDFRFRKGLAEFYPGFESTFLNGLMKARLMRGNRLDGVENAALGMTVNFSPLLIDAGVSIPTRGLHRKAGGWQASVSYRFGAPSFAGNFIGAAAAAADSLRTEISQLEEKRNSMASEAQAQGTNRDVATNELAVLQRRLKESQNELRLMRKRRDELEYELSGLGNERSALQPKPPKPKPKPVVPRANWPKRHTVKDGDTLRGLAERYYGDAARWEPIYEANRDKVDRGLPRLGETLNIPEPSWPR